MCHKGDTAFRTLCYKAIKYLLSHEAEKIEQKDLKDQEDPKYVLTLQDFIDNFNEKNKDEITENTIKAMKHAIEASASIAFILFCSLLFFTDII